jgi:ABC-type bacteriocin/lantibiotic exporter with double-glycine peptidase domain
MHIENPVWLKRKVPLSRQLPEDNSCGPRVILMVADSFEKERGRKLYADEWSRVIELTMNNDLKKEFGTSKQNLIKGLKVIGFNANTLKGRSDRGKLANLRSALERDHPIIVFCRIPYDGQHYKHYAVVVGMDKDNVFLRDPFPHLGMGADAIVKIPREEFMKKRWTCKDYVWGLKRWGLEVSIDSN